jgi:hypothetical protein
MVRKGYYNLTLNEQRIKQIDRLKGKLPEFGQMSRPEVVAKSLDFVEQWGTTEIKEKKVCRNVKV